MEAVGGDGAKSELLAEDFPVHGKGAPGERAGSQGQDGGRLPRPLHPLHVGEERPEVGKRPVGPPDRLGLLEVGVTGQDHVQGLLRQPDQSTAQVPQIVRHHVGGLHSPEAHVGGHLIVPGAGRVELPRHLAHLLEEEPLHEGVDVLVGEIGEVGVFQPPGHGIETGLEGVPLVGGEHSRIGQGRRPGSAPPDVLAPEPPIQIEAPVQGLHGRSHPALEAAAPEGLPVLGPIPSLGPVRVCRCPRFLRIPVPVDTHHELWANSSVASWRALAGSSPPDRMPRAWAATALRGRPKSLMKPAASEWA